VATNSLFHISKFRFYQVLLSYYRQSYFCSFSSISVGFLQISSMVQNCSHLTEHGCPVLHCIHKSPPRVRIMSQMMPNHDLPSHSFKVNYYIILLYAEVLRAVTFLQISSPKPYMHISMPPGCYLPLTSHFPGFITPIIYNEDYKL